jgi:phosphatidylethanolamine/phosphatidyl-N-methylethanolamine N-methyltransferase
VNADACVFFSLWLQKPLRIAAVNPSGARLADAVARCIDLARPGPVLELGAGTGSLTQGLVRAGCSPERIIALEREPALVAVLRREFPMTTVIAGDATRIGEYLTGSVERLAGVVSSLPIKWFPAAAQYAIVKPCFRSTGTGRPLSPADKRVFFTLADPPPGNCRPGGLPGLVQPAAGAGLGLLRTLPAS